VPRHRRRNIHQRSTMPGATACVVIMGTDLRLPGPGATYIRPGHKTLVRDFTNGTTSRFRRSISPSRSCAPIRSR
jgi:hypothetical protein